MITAKVAEVGDEHRVKLDVTGAAPRVENPYNTVTLAPERLWLTYSRAFTARHNDGAAYRLIGATVSGARLNKAGNPTGHQSDVRFSAPDSHNPPPAWVLELATEHLPRGPIVAAYLPNDAAIDLDGVTP